MASQKNDSLFIIGTCRVMGPMDGIVCGKSQFSHCHYPKEISQMIDILASDKDTLEPYYELIFRSMFKEHSVSGIEDIRKNFRSAKNLVVEISSMKFACVDSMDDGSNPIYVNLLNKESERFTIRKGILKENEFALECISLARKLKTKFPDKKTIFVSHCYPKSALCRAQKFFDRRRIIDDIIRDIVDEELVSDVIIPGDLVGEDIETFSVGKNDSLDYNHYTQQAKDSVRSKILSLLV